MRLSISQAAIRRLYVTLSLASGILILVTLLSDLEVGVVANTWGRQLNLKAEGNIAVWFSSAVLLLAAAAALTIAFTIDAASSWGRWLWSVVALFFLGLSIDETAQLHEGVGRRFTTTFGNVPYLTEGALPGFAWLIVLLPFAVLFIVVAIAALRTVSGRSRRAVHLISAGLSCWIGVLLAEFIEAQLMRWSMERSIQGVIEEGLELSGVVLFIIGFIDVLRAGNPARLHARPGAVD